MRRKEAVVLTARMERFCQEFAASGNAYQSALKAGYSEQYASKRTFILEQRPDVKARLQELYEERAAASIAEGRELKQRLTEIIRCTAKEEILMTVGTGEGKSEPVRLMKAPAFKDQMKAIELLGRMGGMFNDKVNVEANVPVVLMGYDDIGE